MDWTKLEEEQHQAARLLQNSLTAGRLAHAYLFEGGRRTGKRAAAKLLAMSVFCLEREEGGKPDPCGQCVNCRRIEHGNHPDVQFIEPDGLSIKKEQISMLRTDFSRSAMESSRKLYVISDAEKMTVQAANSLLKFLEEPHAGTIAVLVTEQPQQLLPTVISRCQSIPFQALTAEVFSRKLAEAGVPETKAYLLALLTADIEEALRLSNDDWFAQARKIVLKLYEIQKENPLYAMTYVQMDWLVHFKEKQQTDLGLSLLLYIYKDILNIQVEKDGQLIYPDLREQWKRDALQTSLDRISEDMTAILNAKRKLHANMNPQLLMEQLVLNLQGGPSFV